MRPRRKPLGALPLRRMRAHASTRLAVQLIGLVIVAGTFGYVAIEGWSLWDSLYMTVITVTTVGYKEVHDLSRAGQLFTVILLVAGVGTVFYSLTLIAARIVETGLSNRWHTRRYERMLDSLEHHVIVCGYGRIGRIIVDEFRRQDVAHVVVDRDPEKAHAIVAEGGLAVAAEAGGEDVLRRLRVDRARALVTAVSTDADNVYTVLSARLIRPDLFIVARADSDDARRKILRAGADRVISPYLIGGVQLAQTALRPAVVDFVQLVTRSDRLDLMLEQITLAQGSPFAGHSIASANLRQRFGVIVVGVQRGIDNMDFNPSPDVVMQPGDQLVVLGPHDKLKILEQVAAGATVA